MKLATERQINRNNDRQKDRKMNGQTDILRKDRQTDGQETNMEKQTEE